MTRQMSQNLPTLEYSHYPHYIPLDQWKAGGAQFPYASPSLPQSEKANSHLHPEVPNGILTQP